MKSNSIDDLDCVEGFDTTEVSASELVGCIIWKESMNGKIDEVGVAKTSWKIVSVKDNEQREIVIYDCEILTWENKERLVGCRSF